MQGEVCSEAHLCTLQAHRRCSVVPDLALVSAVGGKPRPELGRALSQAGVCPLGPFISFSKHLLFLSSCLPYEEASKSHCVSGCSPSLAIIGLLNLLAVYFSESNTEPPEGLLPLDCKQTVTSHVVIFEPNNIHAMLFLYLYEGHALALVVDQINFPSSDLKSAPLFLHCCPVRLNCRMLLG